MNNLIFTILSDPFLDLTEHATEANVQLLGLKHQFDLIYMLELCIYLQTRKIYYCALVFKITPCERAKEKKYTLTKH